MVPGCDGAGTVEALGAGVTRWAVGDEVVVNPSFACGRCPECLADRSVFCAEWGIMGEQYWGTHGGVGDRRARPTLSASHRRWHGKKRVATACAGSPRTGC